jgi:hypothetical protein
MPALLVFLIVVVTLISAQGCAPARGYRPLPPAAVSPAPPLASLPAAPEPEKKPALERGAIREEDLKERRPPPPAKAKERATPPPIVKETPSPLPDDVSLIAKITPRTPPQRAASLRLTEEGRKLLEAGDFAKALARLEKTISIDSTNPYGYYYLAQTHFRLGRFQESLNFLDVAESLFASEPYWLAEVFALKGENFRGLGSVQKANTSYAQALRLNPGNRVAAEGLSSLKGETPPLSR